METLLPPPGMQYRIVFKRLQLQLDLESHDTALICVCVIVACGEWRACGSQESSEQYGSGKRDSVCVHANWMRLARAFNVSDFW